jgi:hypothetical protein
MRTVDGRFDRGTGQPPAHRGRRTEMGVLVTAPFVRAVLTVAGLAAGLLAGCVETPSPTAPSPTAPSPEVHSSAAAQTPVTDPETGVRADLPGPVRKEREQVIDPDQQVFGNVYRAAEPSGLVEAVLRVNPLPREERISPETTAERTAHYLLGTVTESRPLDVDGHPALDVRIDGLPRDGGSGTGTLLARIVDTPQAEVSVEASGDTADAALVRQVFDQVCAGLQIP